MQFDLQENIKMEAFALSVQQQIEKDFAKFNLNFPDLFTEKALSKDEILALIEEQVVFLMKEGETRFLQLLYTIDLSENTFLKLIKYSDFIPRISYEILQREAYKVFLRSYFSKGNG